MGPCSVSCEPILGLLCPHWSLLLGRESLWPIRDPCGLITGPSGIRCSFVAQKRALEDI